MSRFSFTSVLFISSLLWFPGCNGSGLPPEIKSEAFGERRDVSNYLEQMFDAGKTNRQTLSYIEGFADLVSSNSADVESFQSLLIKLKKNRDQKKLGPMLIEMAQLIELPEKYQSRLVREGDPQPAGPPNSN